MNSSHNDALLSIYASPHTVFTLSGISLMQENVGHLEGLARRLHYHVSRGNLLNPRRGIYAKQGYNPEELACLLYTPCYLSLEYVLQRAGVVFQYDESLTAVSYLCRSVIVDGNAYTYRRIKGTILAQTQGIEQRGNVNIASPERAFLDMIYLNSTYHFDNLHAISRKKVAELLPIYQNKRMEIRVKRLLSLQ